MKIISFNIWGGKILEPLLKFIDEESKSTDIFCFQEVLDSSAPMEEDVEERHHLLEILKTKLPEFNYYFSPMQDGWDCGEATDKRLTVGTAIFINKRIKVESFDTTFVYRERNGMVGTDMHTIPYNAQFLTFLDDSGKKITIANVHGISDWPKTDTPARITQSEIINEFLSKKNTSEIICGDFNLFPDTESVAMLAHGRKNLINDFGIQNTRTSLIPTPHVSDYFFVSQDLGVEDFLVPSLSASDHLPLVLVIS